MTPGIITAIVTIRVGGRARTIQIDHVTWRTTSAAAIRLLGVTEGDVIDVDVLAQRLDVAEKQALRERALGLLGYRERSVAELRSKLLEDAYGAVEVDDVVDAFAKAGFVDDERFADVLVRSAAGSKALGRRRVQRDLVMRGVDDDLARAVLDRYMPAELEAERARALAERLYKSGDRVDSLAARIVRKGFSPRMAFEAARHAAEAGGLEDPSTDASDLR
ncbi:MAG: recombination regulator RecX [Actinomycetia bacterium]|nr:recombination regulator RecX [Actinomycetes bacterium]